MNKRDSSDFVSSCIRVIDASLDSVLLDSGLFGELLEAVRYSVLGGGKRIRPTLSLALIEDLGGSIENFVKPVLSIELIHCASLIHDDLPGLDNDDMRRGQPSCHKAFSESSAILGGDALVPVAFELIIKSVIPNHVKLELCRELAVAFREICSGQQLDLENPVNLVDRKLMYRKKTGALFGCSVVFGLSLASEGISRETAEVAREAGVALGYCFQILDDLLDDEVMAKEKGRAFSSDMKNSKPSFRSDLLLARSEFERSMEHFKRGIGLVEEFGDESRIFQLSDILLGKFHGTLTELIEKDRKKSQLQ